MNKKTYVITLIGTAGVVPIVLYFLFLRNLPFPHPEETIRYIPLLDQAMVVITAFVIKPLYMLISLVLVWKLRDARSSDLVALRWGLLAFFIGEAFCSINYLFFEDRSVLSEFLHNYGMIVSFGFIGYALQESLDKNVIHYSHPTKRCSFISLCGKCVKQQDIACQIKQLFLLSLIILDVLVFIPLLAEVREISYYADIFGTPYNFIRPSVHQLFEIRYAPLSALLMFLIAFFSTHFSKEKQIPELARISLFAGIGALGFGIFRLSFNSIFANNLAWAASWEELTEFILMVSIAYLVWFFQKTLKVLVRAQDK